MRHGVTAMVFAAVAISAAACTSDDSGASATTVLDTDEPAAIVEVGEWQQLFDDENVVGTIAVREVGTGRTLVWDLARAEQPRLPASTFKILNSMIILQTGVVDDVDELVEWDGVEREIEAWNRDHSLRSGIEVSAVWAYQELARRVGADRMAEWVAAADYGNADISGGIDQFWLRGGLRISPLEQLDVLERMVVGDLPFDDDVVADVQEILVREQGDDWTWSHKTGTAPSSGAAAPPALGWLVGTTEYDEQRWVFAMNVDLESTDAARPLDPRVRELVSRAVLVDVGALPAG